MLKFKNYADLQIDISNGTFAGACEKVSADFGEKGVDWYNVMSDMKTFMQFRYAIVSYWDILDFLPAGALEEFEQFAKDENLYFSIDGKKFVKQIDVKDFVKIYNS